MLSCLKEFWKDAGISIYRRKEENRRILLLKDRQGTEFGRFAAQTEAETYTMLFEYLLFYTSDLCTGFRKSGAGIHDREFIA
jgi:hypothetical protein